MENRFWNKVNKTDKCWLWTATISGEGYGSFSIDGNSKGAHIVSWELTNKRRVPKGLQVLHTCDIRHCVNPSHLWIGTLLENLKDRDTKNRQAKGIKNGRHKLTEENVKFIKYSNLSDNHLGKMFSISRTQARDIKNGKYWKHL